MKGTTIRLLGDAGSILATLDEMAGDDGDGVPSGTATAAYLRAQLLTQTALVYEVAALVTAVEKVTRKP